MASNFQITYPLVPIKLWPTKVFDKKKKKNKKGFSKLILFSFKYNTYVSFNFSLFF